MARAVERWRGVCAGAILAALVAGAGAGCAGSRPAPPPPDLPTAMPSEEERARTAPGAPSALPAPPIAIGPSGSLPPPASPADSLLTPEPQNARPGYSVQLLATGDPRFALERTREYREIFGLPVHVRQEGVLYKIRVGECRTREEAEALRRQALALGYADAFIVEAPIAPE